MKYLIILSLFLIGCSSQYHIKRAIKKNPSIQTEFVDTLTFTRIHLDTIYTSDSTFYIEQRIIHFDTIVHYQKYDFSGMRTWFETWQMNKTERKRNKLDASIDKTEIRQGNKTDRHEAKQERKEANNSFKWLFIITLVLLILLIVGLWLRNKIKL